MEQKLNDLVKQLLSKILNKSFNPSLNITENLDFMADLSKTVNSILKNFKHDDLKNYIDNLEEVKCKEIEHGNNAINLTIESIQELNLHFPKK